MSTKVFEIKNDRGELNFQSSGRSTIEAWQFYGGRRDGKCLQLSQGPHGQPIQMTKKQAKQLSQEIVDWLIGPIGYDHD